jgi:hypothetical protein
MHVETNVTALGSRFLFDEAMTPQPKLCALSGLSAAQGLEYVMELGA